MLLLCALMVGLIKRTTEEAMSEFEKDYLAQREELAVDRTDQAVQRTELARERNELAKNRTRLANKRTFLAWCRTALSFMTFGFLLEKIDAFFVSEHMTVSKILLSELGMLGKIAFVVGPVLMLFAGWRYYALEKELGLRKDRLSIVPEMLIFGVLMSAVLIYVFF